MLVLFAHKRLHPTLTAGMVVLPIGSWSQTRIPLRILRASADGGAANFITLGKLTDGCPVALLEGRDLKDRRALSYAPLSSLGPDDRRVLDEALTIDSMRQFANDPNELVRLVLGRPLKGSELLWTKDYRVLRTGTRSGNRYNERRKKK